MLIPAVALAVAAGGLGILGQPAGCDLRQGAYEEWIATKPSGSNGRAKPALPKAEASKREEIERTYISFVRALSEAYGNPAALESCCAAASADRLGALSCSFATYLARGRTGSAAFVTSLPAGPHELGVLWELDTVFSAAAAAGAEVPGAFGSKRPSERVIEELFLLVLDSNEAAITKFFNIATALPADEARLVDTRIELMFREAPSVLVTNWFLLRRYKPKLRAVSRAMLARAGAADRARISKGVEAFCGSKTDPDCQEILRMIGAR